MTVISPPSVSSCGTLSISKPQSCFKLDCGSLWKVDFQFNFNRLFWSLVNENTGNDTLAPLLHLKHPHTAFMRATWKMTGTRTKSGKCCSMNIQHAGVCDIPSEKCDVQTATSISPVKTSEEWWIEVSVLKTTGLRKFVFWVKVQISQQFQAVRLVYIRQSTELEWILTVHPA